jgi:RNA polymerase sigma factor (sigma-70 family)
LLTHDATRPADASIIECSLRDPEAFSALYELHAADVHRYVARRLGTEVADDLMAETFVIAFRRRRSYDLSRSDARPWLYGIVANLVRRHRRAEARRWRALVHAAPPTQSEPLSDAVEARVSAQALRRELAAALAALPTRHRDVLLMVAWGGLSYEATAVALDLPIGTVRSRMHRARGALRAALDELYLDETHQGEHHG